MTGLPTGSTPTPQTQLNHRVGVGYSCDHCPYRARVFVEGAGSEERAGRVAAVAPCPSCGERASGAGAQARRYALGVALLMSLLLAATLAAIGYGFVQEQPWGDPRPWVAGIPALFLAFYQYRQESPTTLAREAAHARWEPYEQEEHSSDLAGYMVLRRERMKRGERLFPSRRTL